MESLKSGVVKSQMQRILTSWAVMGHTSCTWKAVRGPFTEWSGLRRTWRDFLQSLLVSRVKHPIWRHSLRLLCFSNPQLNAKNQTASMQSINKISRINVDPHLVDIKNPFIHCRHPHFPCCLQRLLFPGNKRDFFSQIDFLMSRKSIYGTPHVPFARSNGTTSWYECVVSHRHNNLLRRLFSS